MIGRTRAHAGNPARGIWNPRIFLCRRSSIACAEDKEKSVHFPVKGFPDRDKEIAGDAGC